MQGSNEAIYNQHRDDLLRYAASLVGKDRADDVVSTVVVRVLANGGMTRLDEPRPYLFRAVLNEARSVLRRGSNEPLQDAAAHSADEGDRHVLETVMGLPPRQRAAIYLVYWTGETMQGAADLMGCSSGSVKRYLHMAKRRLKGVL
jgi:RNA polymerase sigma factor (sigma-70 family)